MVCTDRGMHCSGLAWYVLIEAWAVVGWYDCNCVLWVAMIMEYTEVVCYGTYYLRRAMYWFGMACLE